MAVWLRGSGDTAAPFRPEVCELIEAAYKSFWTEGSGRAVLDLGDEEAACIDFRTLEVRPRSAGPGAEGQTAPACRREPWTSTASSSCAHGPVAAAEWGHGQDVVGGSAFSQYTAEIAALLEDSYQRFRTGGGLKGVMFTGSNGADYLVDFAKMQQVRLATRNVRPVYRHNVGPGFRDGRSDRADGGAALVPTALLVPASPVSIASRPSVDSQRSAAWTSQRSDASTWLAATWCLDPVALWNVLVAAVAGKRA